MRHTSRQRRAAVTPSASSFRSVVAPVRWVAVGPGGGVCGAVARTKRRSDNIRAVAVVLSVPLRCTAFTSTPAEVSPGPPLRPAGCRARLNRRNNHGSRFAWCRGGGSAIPLPLVARRLRSLRSLRPGPHGRALARDRAARLRLLSRAVTDRSGWALRSSPPTAWAPAAGIPALCSGTTPAAWPSSRCRAPSCPPA